MAQQDNESLKFGTSMREALTNAGFSVQFSPRQIFNLYQPGITFCWNTSAPNLPAYAETIARIFLKNGIEITANAYNKSILTNDLQIIVCQKPINLNE